MIQPGAHGAEGRKWTTYFFFVFLYQACLRDASQYRERDHTTDSSVESGRVGRREALFLAQDIMACIVSSCDVQL